MHRGARIFARRRRSLGREALAEFSRKMMAGEVIRPRACATATLARRMPIRFASPRPQLFSAWRIQRFAPRPAVPTVGDSGHGRFCLSRPGGIARWNPRCYAISVERKQNTTGTARAIDALLEGLNPAQRSAAIYGIEAEQGSPPLLIAAGAGTGKTKTLAHRVARLIFGGADPRRLLL
jgi:hypothetical protein